MKNLLIFIALLFLVNTANADNQTIHLNKMLLLDHLSYDEAGTDIIVVAKTTTVREQVEQIADEEEQLTDEGGVFAERYGAFHASVGVQGEWTDNLYNVEDKQDNLLTTLNAGAWYTYPERSRKPISIVTNNTSPGGLQYSQPDNKFFNKYGIYIGGNLDYRQYSENSELDMLAGSVTGQMYYDPTPKLSFQLSDKYSLDQDRFDITNATSENQRVYGSNVFSALADWQISAKFAAGVEYRNYGLVYDDAVNDFLNRNDQGLGLTGYFDYSPKTSFFVQYNTVISSYDEVRDNINRENTNGYWYAGVNWKSTIKTSLMAKAGYQQTDYDCDDFADDDSFTFDLNWNWRPTVKTTVVLNSAYSIEQTDSESALNKTVLALGAGINYRFLNRLNGKVNFIYENSDYAQFDDFSRTDDRYNASIGLQLAIFKWLGAGVSYSFDYKDSNIDELDYETNIFSISITGTY